MCLAVPGLIVEVSELGDNRMGTVQFAGIARQICLDFVPEANPGDYVIVHVGFAITRVDAEEARRTFDLLEKMGLLAEEELAAEGEPGP